MSHITKKLPINNNLYSPKRLNEYHLNSITSIRPVTIKIITKSQYISLTYTIYWRELNYRWFIGIKLTIMAVVSQLANNISLIKY